MELEINLYTKLISTQNIYSGSNRHCRMEYKRIISFFTKQSIEGWWTKKKPFDYPVHLKFQFYIGEGKIFDTGNYSYTAKIIEDCLKGVVLKDDDARYVHNWEILVPVHVKMCPYNRCKVIFEESKI